MEICQCKFSSIAFFVSPPSSPTPLVASEELGDGQAETSAQQQARMSASSATRELDELMASLSDFKVQSNVSRFQHLALVAAVVKRR